MEYNNLILEEKITCRKIKSKAKTLLIGQISKTNLDKIEDPNIANTFEFKKIKIKFDNCDNKNFELVKGLLINSTIIISTGSNPKISDSHILVFPGYLGEIYHMPDDMIEMNIFFKNFFPQKIITKQSELYFMIWFRKIIPEKIFIKSTIGYNHNKLVLDTLNTIVHGNITFVEKIFIQQTQTFNLISKAKNNNPIEKKCNFDNICRGFWIRIDIKDYNNLKELKFIINGLDRFVFTQEQIELIGIKKIHNNYVLIYLDLEIGNLEWKLPSDINKIKQIYSNSLNCSRVLEKKFTFKFESNYIHNNIQITSLSLNLIDISNNKLLWKYW